ncbi:MAG TPA: nuclear transport factor 2 family protein [Terriglobales bacterium]|nr:nuclear transport factor 2 family protein [Terriglobales bacterium]
MRSAFTFRRQSGFALGLTALLAVTICSAGQETRRIVRNDSKAEENEIRQLVAEYAKSVDDADPALAAQVWLVSPDVSFIHPRGHEHGFDQIKQNIYTHLMGETFSERKLSPRDVAVHVHENSAWVEFYWDFVAKFRRDGSPITTHGRETQVYWKTPDGWRLIHVHYSGMPVTQERQGF